MRPPLNLLIISLLEPVNLLNWPFIKCRILVLDNRADLNLIEITKKNYERGHAISEKRLLRKRTIQRLRVPDRYSGAGTHVALFFDSL